LPVRWDKVTAVAERYEKQILSLPQVVGMSTGAMRGPGEVQLCIRVYVREPVERGELEYERIPAQLEGIPVDVVVSGDIVALDSHC
jgi:hypothetical protein